MKPKLGPCKFFDSPNVSKIVRQSLRFVRYLLEPFQPEPGASVAQEIRSNQKILIAISETIEATQTPLPHSSHFDSDANDAMIWNNQPDCS